MDLGLSTGARWGVHQKMWDEAEGVIALASTGCSEDEAPRGRQRDSDISAVSSLNDEFSDDDVKLPIQGASVAPVAIERASILLPDDDVFGSGSGETKSTEPPSRHRKSFERLNNRHLKSHSTSSTESRKASTFGKSDPVAMARSMVERMQRTSSDSLQGTNPSTAQSESGMFQFDTKMLGPLLEKVKKLLSGLEESLKDEEHFGGLSRENFELGIKCGGA